MPSERFFTELFDLSPTEWLRSISTYVEKRFPPEAQAEAVERVMASLKSVLADEAKEKVSPFRRGRMKVSEMPEEEEPVARLWFGIYPGALTLLCGESGRGKSSILYNICIHGARNEPLWNVPFGINRPAKILYVDPENSGDFDLKRAGLCRKKIERIGQGKPELLEIHDGNGVVLNNATALADLEEVLIEEKFDALVLDPIINLFGTKDENDNAEAAIQFNALRRLTKKTGVALVAVHHTGRDAMSIFGRGATSRFGMADVVLSLRARSDQEDSDDDYGQGTLHEMNDIVRLRIEKNRIEPGKASLFLQMIGDDKFERVNFDAWKQSARSTDMKGNKSQQAEEFVFDYLSREKAWRSTDAIYQAMQRKGVGERNTDKAIKSLLDDGTLAQKRTGRGGKAMYCVAGMDTQQDQSSSAAEDFLNPQMPYKEDDDTEWESAA
jgi:RecA-family ATPase